MGTSLSDMHRFIKPDDTEPIDVEHLNKNWDLLDKLIPRIFVGKIPEGKTPQIYAGAINVNTGAGGENREAEKATDVNGVGGVWLGYNGIPNFEGLSYVDVSDAGNTTAFQAEWIIQDQNTTRIRFRGKRFDTGSGGTWAAGYGGVNLNLIIIGW